MSVARSTALAPLLIMGSPRSGTTFLSQMVNRFLDIHVCRDNGTMLRFYHSLPHYEPLERRANLQRLVQHLYKDKYFNERIRRRGMRLSEEDLLGRIKRPTYGAVVDAVFSATASGHGKASWGYKRASFAQVTGHQIEELFPKAKFVHCIRDARDVVLSMRNSTHALLERSWHFGALDWVGHLRAGRDIGRRLGPERYLEVRYERFMADPVGVLGEIAVFSDADTSHERLARISSELPGLVKTGNTEKWRHAVPPDGLRKIERVAGESLRSLGYPLVYPEIAGAPVGPLELVQLQLDRAASNLLQTQFRVMAEYRLTVLKGKWNARFGRR